MTTFLYLSSWIYGKLLFLHPEALRRDFGQEMAFVFAQDLAGAWRDRRVAGVIRIWLCALGEVVRIGLPGQRTNPDIVVPAVAFVLNAAALSAELIFALRQASVAGVHGPLLKEAIMSIVLWPSFATALISFAAIRIPKFSPTISLELFLPYCGAGGPRER